MNRDALMRICSDVQTSGVDVVLQLPCDRIVPFLARISTCIPYITLTREEEGVGIAAGVSLAGAKPLMVVQSSGMGNMINALLSLTQFYGFPLPIFISQRGVYKENIAAQVPMGTRLPKIIDSMEVEHETYSSIDDFAGITAELENIYLNNILKCFLITPAVCEVFDKLPLSPSKKIGFLPSIDQGSDGNSIISKTMSEHNSITISKPGSNRKDRYQVLEELADYLAGKAVLCNMGYPSRELYTIMDQSSNFYMLGSLGLVSSIGLGVALFTKKEVVVIDGDGSLLMNPNALLSIGNLQPKNLTIICIDNNAYGSTGNQPTMTASGIRLEELAAACRIPNIIVTDDISDISQQTGSGCRFIKIPAKPGNAKVGTIHLTPEQIKNRFMDWLKS